MNNIFLISLTILAISRGSYSQTPCSTKPCGSLPCLESSSLPNGYICQCGPSDFKPVCDSITTTTPLAATLCPTQTNFCMNSGVCYIVGGLIRCICQPNFSGAFCETPINGCTSTPCNNSGTCATFSNGTFQGCICTLGFSGTYCESIIATTQSTTLTTSASIALCPNQNVCFNQGVCYLVSGSVRCVCSQGFSGTLCEISSTTAPSNGCFPNPCLNGGTCVSQTNSAFYGCFCSTGYIGVYCQTKSTNDLVSSCAAGTIGSRCETVYFSCTRNGRFKDQYFCSSGKYFECVYYGLAGTPNGVLYSRECPSSLRFNELTDKCDYAENVRC